MISEFTPFQVIHFVDKETGGGGGSSDLSQVTQWLVAGQVTNLSP